ncbi:hypothetical protein SLEP1_g15638 [Rubroshorea leprosula]|uniref:Reticulon-like protein n=1 Tax=Rubroshorea leprosula TaxID=152421 RepID=A0AAV5IX71_9ROSI|nr:hypothetical protein SLEP1_g15638 [Rubroshorea leprosula]
MDLGSGRRREGVRSSVVAGSVWESRMKSDQVKGGIKVFNGEEENQTTLEENGGVERRLNSKRGQTMRGAAVGGKRKTWKSESFEPIHIAKGKTEPPAGKSPIPVTKELTTVSVDGIKRSPVRVKKGRSEGSKEISKSADGIEKSPINVRRLRSEISKGSAELSKEIVESDEGIENNSVEKKDLIKVVDQSSGEKESRRNSVLDDQGKGNEGSDEATEKNESEGNCKELGVCEEKVISSSVSVKNTDEDEGGDEEFDEEDEVEEEEEEEEEEDEIEVEIEKKRIDIKEMNVPEVPAQKPEPTVDEVKRINHFNNRTSSFSSPVNKQLPPVEKRATPIYTNPPSKPTRFSASDDHQSFPQTHNNKLQNLVDIVMWRDISKSAFIFGIGTFVIISSSYTQNLNISFISVISYMGLVYLAAIFLYRSIICRGLVEINETSCVLGEEEAVWLLKLFLPYLNEFLLKLRALFSGDPATTMKLAMLLFVLARSGSSITIWKMAKLGFFGVFTVPIVCSSYSHQFTAYGKFWIRRFRDAWDSCTHKKAVAMGIFTLVWNLSSTIARIWAAFMLFVALRYYQQAMLDDCALEEDASPVEETLQGRTGHPRPGLRPTVVESNMPNKLKKGL